MGARPAVPLAAPVTGAIAAGGRIVAVGGGGGSTARAARRPCTVAAARNPTGQASAAGPRRSHAVRVGSPHAITAVACGLPGRNRGRTGVARGGVGGVGGWRAAIVVRACFWVLAAVVSERTTLCVRASVLTPSQKKNKPATGKKTNESHYARRRRLLRLPGARVHHHHAWRHQGAPCWCVEREWVSARAEAAKKSGEACLRWARHVAFVQQ